MNDVAPIRNGLPVRSIIRYSAAVHAYDRFQFLLAGSHSTWAHTWIGNIPIPVKSNPICIVKYSCRKLTQVMQLRQYAEMHISRP